MNLNLTDRDLAPDFLFNLTLSNAYRLTDKLFTPIVCLSLHRVAIIIPYRDRLHHLHILLAHLHPILQRQQLEYKVIVVEQVIKLRLQLITMNFNHYPTNTVGVLLSLAHIYIGKLILTLSIGPTHVHTRSHHSTPTPVFTHTNTLTRFRPKSERQRKEAILFKEKKINTKINTNLTFNTLLPGQILSRTRNGICRGNMISHFGYGAQLCRFVLLLRC